MSCKSRRETGIKLCGLMKNFDEVYSSRFEIKGSNRYPTQHKRCNLNIFITCGEIINVQYFSYENILKLRVFRKLENNKLKMDEKYVHYDDNFIID